jgi:hypothetical protein
MVKGYLAGARKELRQVAKAGLEPGEEDEDEDGDGDNLKGEPEEEDEDEGEEENNGQDEDGGGNEEDEFEEEGVDFEDEIEPRLQTHRITQKRPQREDDFDDLEHTSKRRRSGSANDNTSDEE